MEVINLPLSAIQLDARNPRIAHMQDNAIHQNITEDFIAIALGRSAPADEEHGQASTYSSLRASIKANGGLISPIIVRPIENDRYLVIEGNTRVAIFRELHREEKTDPRWDTIPAVIRTDLDANDEHGIRLQAHLVGPRPWRAYAKGRYLHYLYHHEKWSLNQLLDFCGGQSRKGEIEEYIDAYADMQKYYGDHLRSGRGYSQFSAFVELQKAGIKEALMSAGHSLSDFAQWLADGNIGPQQHVRQLPRILGNPAAKKRFLDHNAREAMKLLEQPSATALIKDAALDQLAAALAEKIRTEAFDVLRALLDDRSGPRAAAVMDCYDELRSVLKHFNFDVDGSD